MDLTHELINLLQQKPYTQDSILELKKILVHLEGKTLPQALGSPCAILKIDFWHGWEEYKEAHSHRKVLLQHIQSIESGSHLSETIAERTRLDTEGEEIQNKMYLVDVEISRLQSKQESLDKAFAINQGRLEEVLASLDKERCEEEEKRRMFTLQRITATRFSIKENICQHVLLVLNEALDLLRF